MGTCFSEAALAVLEFSDSVEEILMLEIGPEEVGEKELGISHLPEEEIADSEFAAGADKEVGVGVFGSREIVAERILVDL